MALNTGVLETELSKLLDSSDPAFLGFPIDTSIAATNWGNAYNTYALAAADISGDALLVANLPGFITQLGNLLPADPLVGSPTVAANAFEQAFITYWTGATFAIGSTPPPVGICPNIGGNTIFASEITSVVSVITPDVLSNALAVEFAILSGDAVSKVTSLANIFHTATTTAVYVLISGLDTTPPVAGPLPITNLCTIF